jgi:hypothetical protein
VTIEEGFGLVAGSIRLFYINLVPTSHKSLFKKQWPHSRHNSLLDSGFQASNGWRPTSRLPHHPVPQLRHLSTNSTALAPLHSLTEIFALTDNTQLWTELYCCRLSLIRPQHGPHKKPNFSFIHVTKVRTPQRTQFLCYIERTLPRGGSFLRVNT